MTSEDTDRHRDHQPIVGAAVVDARHDHSADRRRDDGEKADPQERGRVQGRKLRADVVEIERRARVERRDAVGEHQHQPTASSATDTYVTTISRRPATRSAVTCWDRRAAARSKPVTASDSLEHLERSEEQDDDEQQAQVADVDPVGDARPGRRPDEDTDRRGAGDVRVDAAADEIDDRAGGGRDADHHVARRCRDLERDAHREVHQRHLDDPATDAEQRRHDARERRADDARSARLRT